tara:strand:- start:2695 stop:3084 length:390 start_codon:yes stop_codon:yes gene_type:complete
MTVAVTTLRATIATALSNPTVWQVFSFPPASPLANSVVVEPDDPYLSPSNNSRNTVSPLANFRIKLYLPLLDNQGSLQDIETFIVGVFNKLAESNLQYSIGTVSGVSVDTSAGDLLTCEMRVSILTSWS